MACKRGICLNPLFVAATLKFKVRAELNTVPAILQLVRDSQLVTILSEETIRGNEELVSVPIDVPGNVMEGCILWLKGSYMKASAKEFMRMLMEHNTISQMVNDI